MNRLKDEVISYLSISVIEPDANLPRKLFNEKKVNELANSIKEKGVLEPLTVRPKKDNPAKYSVVMGEMRLKAALLAGQDKVPCIIKDVNDKEALELALIENIQRSDLTPFEEAWGILKLIKNYGHSIEQVMQKIGKDHKFINMRLQLLSLPEEIQKYVADGKLGIIEATSLVYLNPKKQSELVQEISSDSLSREQVKEIILKKTVESKEKWVRDKGKIAPRRIKSQIKILTELLTALNYDKVPYNDKREIKIALLELKKLLGKTIKEMKKVYI